MMDYFAQATTAPSNWLGRLLLSDDPALAVAHAVLILSIVIAAGLALGQIRIFKISLGIAGVLFSGLAFAHFGLGIETRVLEFARDFGLILFVYTIGLQVGPGFLGSLRKAGLPLNLMAAAVVLLGAAMTMVAVFASGKMGRPIDMPTAVGLLAGATTNTPSLAAAQQAVKETPGATADQASQTVRGYAIAYPFGVIGIILTMLLLRTIFRVDVAKENELFAKTNLKGSAMQAMSLQVTNWNLQGKRIGEIPQFAEGGVVVSRVLHGNIMQVAKAEVVVHVGDVIHAVGDPHRLNELKLLIGAESSVDATHVPSSLASRRIVVTRSGVLGKTLEELELLKKYSVTVTRTSRAEIQIAATPGWRIQFGDTLLVVGEPAALDFVAKELGDSRKSLEHPHFIPVFIGLALGVVLGSVPIALPGMPAPVRLGLAGGPLVVAIFFSRVGQVGPLTWYMPRAANFALREFGIALFLACVGLKAGHGFAETLKGDGLFWMAWGSLITFVPLMVVGLVARAVFKLNYVSVCGMLAGSMTDPPALQFANQMAGGEAPSVAYATVYPLTMLLRVVVAQVLILFFWK